MTLDRFLVAAFFAYLYTGFYVAIHRSHIWIRRGKTIPWWDALASTGAWPYWAFYCKWHGHVVRWYRLPGQNHVFVGKCIHCETRAILDERDILGIGSIALEIEDDARRCEFSEFYGIDIDEVIDNEENRMGPS